MRVLMDEDLDVRLVRLMPTEHEVKTVREMQWLGLLNGALLRQAEQEFDVLVTADQNLPFQQNLTAYALSFLVLVARRTTYRAHEPLMPLVSEALRRRPLDKLMWIPEPPPKAKKRA